MRTALPCVGVILLAACLEPPPEVSPPDPPTSDDGALTSAELLAQITRDELQQLVAPEIDVDNGYAVFSIAYRTQGTDATATVTLPDGVAPTVGFPIVANAHGTVGLDDACRLSGTISGAGLAALFGARGAVGVAPDYLGIGGPGMHPYLDVKSEARAVLDAMRAARALAEREGMTVSLRAAVVGLSQGGHAALAVGAEQPGYAPEIDLRAVGAAAPASGFREHWASIDVEGAHQVYYAMLMYAFAREAGLSAGDVFVADFAAVADELFTMRCAWSPSFDPDEPLLGAALPVDPDSLYLPAARAAFLDEGAVEWIDAGFARRRLPSFNTIAAVRVWQGDADTTVLHGATVELVRALRDGGLDVELTTVDGSGHLDTAFGLVASLDRARVESVAWVQEQLAAP